MNYNRKRLQPYEFTNLTTKLIGSNKDLAIGYSFEKNPLY